MTWWCPCDEIVAQPRPHEDEIVTRSRWKCSLMMRSWQEHDLAMRCRILVARLWHDLATYSPRGRGHGTIWPHPHREDATMGDLAMSLPPRCSHVVITTRLQCLTWYRPEDAIVPQSSHEDVACRGYVMLRLTMSLPVVSQSCYVQTCSV